MLNPAVADGYIGELVIGDHARFAGLGAMITLMCFDNSISY